MVLHRTMTVVFLGLGLACGPSGSTAVESDSEGESEDTGTGGTSGTPQPTATSPTTMTNGSMSGSATTTEGNTGDTGPVDGTMTPETDTMPPPETTDTGECPFGTEGCLCDVGAACDDGLDCNDEGICVAPPACSPIDTDPHDDEATAIGLDMLACGDGADLGVIATIEGPQTDWYSFFGDDSFGCPEQPGALVTSKAPLQVCVFLECTDGGMVDPLNCAPGSADATSPDGRPGCCGDGGAQVEGYDCTGFGSKNVDVFISVGSDEAICVDYGLQYGF